MLQSENLFLALLLVAGTYGWNRAGFRTPSAFRLSAHVPRRILLVVGWALVIGIALRSTGGLLGDGRVQIARSGQMYAYRTRDPRLFWGEIVGEMLLFGGIGAVLIALARRTER